MRKKNNFRTILANSKHEAIGSAHWTGPKLIGLQTKGKRVRKNKRNKRIKRYSIKTGLELW